MGLLVCLMVLAACAPGPQETETPDWQADYVPVVSVTGEVVPEVWTTVAAQVGGTVTEVLVEPGDEVAAGDVLLRLDPTDARVALQQAEASLAFAQAQSALVEAGPHEAEVAIAEAGVKAAEAAFCQAVARRDQLQAGALETEILLTRAQVTTAQADQLHAEVTHDKTMKCYRFEVDGDKKTICPALGPIEEQARYHLQVTNAALEAARADLDVLEATSGDKIEAAQAVISATQAQQAGAQAALDLLRAGATAEEIAARKAAVVQAQTALDAARLGLERTEVRAPQDGTVGVVHVRAGELASPGQPLAVVGNLATLRVETTDLDEIDVARVAPGQTVGVTFDAVPERLFGGRVVRISPMADPGGGGVHYTVVVEMDELDPAIRWGMTAFVDIEVER
jgi:multidrug efflux pump subunit AcrA (membrane-fusion protein)